MNPYRAHSANEMALYAPIVHLIYRVYMRGFVGKLHFDHFDPAQFDGDPVRWDAAPIVEERQQACRFVQEVLDAMGPHRLVVAMQKVTPGGDPDFEDTVNWEQLPEGLRWQPVAYGWGEDGDHGARMRRGWREVNAHGFIMPFSDDTGVWVWTFARQLVDVFSDEREACFGNLDHAYSAVMNDGADEAAKASAEANLAICRNERFLELVEEFARPTVPDGKWRGALAHQHDLSTSIREGLMLQAELEVAGKIPLQPPMPSLCIARDWHLTEYGRAWYAERGMNPDAVTLV